LKEAKKHQKLSLKQDAQNNGNVLLIIEALFFIGKLVGVGGGCQGVGVAGLSPRFTTVFVQV